MGVTIRDVAAAAGVSTATVSRALHGDDRVAVRTRLRVQEVADRLAYRPSVIAARLASGISGSVGYVVGHHELETSGPTLVAACEVLAAHDLDCSVHVVDSGDLAAASCLDRLRGRVDAAIVSLRPGDRAMHDAIAKATMPIVVAGAAVSGLPSVMIDHSGAGALAADHLLATGHRHIVVAAPAALMDAHERCDIWDAFDGGVRRRDPQADLELLAGVDDTSDAGERAMSMLLSRSSPPQAVLCLSESLTHGAARSLRRHGALPGRDVGLLGLGRESLADDLGVSMVAVPVREIGAVAASLLVALLSGSDVVARVHTLAPSLVVRESTVFPGTGLRAG
jgi:LacI family repressor for deo operon, udp, cdd, tsx, nupC, and nupG